LWRCGNREFLGQKLMPSVEPSSSLITIKTRAARQPAYESCSQRPAVCCTGVTKEPSTNTRTSLGKSSSRNSPVLGRKAPRIVLHSSAMVQLQSVRTRHNFVLVCSCERLSMSTWTRSMPPSSNATTCILRGKPLIVARFSSISVVSRNVHSIVERHTDLIWLHSHGCQRGFAKGLVSISASASWL
jgi:hypothetical protein